MFLSLRAALAFSLLYPALSAWFNPYAWVGYFPPFISGAVADPIVLLHIFGVVEIVLAIWILSGRRIFIPCVASMGMLAGIIGFNIAQMDVLFRDVPILVIAGVLAWEERRM